MPQKYIPEFKAKALQLIEEHGQVHGGGVSVGDPSVVGSGGQGW